MTSGLSYQCAIDALGAAADPSYDRLRTRRPRRRHEQHAAYAPELNIVGAAGGGAGVDITSSPQMFEDGNLFSGIPFGAVIGASRGYRDVDLRSVLTPQGLAMVKAAAEMTMEQLVASFPSSAGATVSRSRACSTYRGCVPPSSKAGWRATPMTALHLYHAVHDKYPAVADVDELLEKYRGEGVDVTYRRFRFGGHMTALFAGVPGSLRFLSKRFAAP